ncbi:MAG: polyprenyl synthetase family protein, partial [Candidatus Thermoplasmatota archaeon]|nr:polyprenyl synthetase family protein [Candidatus Thermoplasmatota archaeon]
IGIGFQIWDDLLDLQADEKTLGKPVGSDIKNGKRTLAAVWAMENLRGENREHFLKAYGNQKATKEDIDRAVAAMLEGGAIGYAQERAMKYADKSRKMLEALPPGKDRDILEAVIDYMVTRAT